MSKGQFRCCIYANDYEQTLEFYGGGLGFPVTESWDRGPDDKGTLFRVASGFIEVLARPKTVETTFAWGEAAPRGVMVVIEDDNVDQVYSRVKRAKLRISEDIKDQEWDTGVFG